MSWFTQPWHQLPPPPDGPTHRTNAPIIPDWLAELVTAESRPPWWRPLRRRRFDRDMARARG